MLLRHKWFWKAEEFIIGLLRFELPCLELLLWYFLKYVCPPFPHSFGICYLESKWSQDLFCQSGLQRAAQRCSLLPSPAVPHPRQDPGKEQMCNVVPSVAPGAASTRCPLNQRLQVKHLKMRFVCFPVLVLFVGLFGFFYELLFIVFSHQCFRITANKSWSALEQTFVVCNINIIFHSFCFYSVLEIKKLVGKKEKRPSWLCYKHAEGSSCSHKKVVFCSL